MRNYISIATLLLFVMSLAGCTKEETEPLRHFPSDDAIQALIQLRVDEQRAMGIVVGVMEADGSTRTFFAGKAGVGARSLSTQSVFEIGSITKVFTATLLADMVAKGEIALDDPVAKFLPEDKVTMPTRGGKQITLADLATHRSSLPPIPDNFKPTDTTNPYADYTVEQMYEFLSSHELQHDIGSRPEYSNIGAGLLGHVLARVNGTSYEALVSERILKPLGMINTAITLTDETRDWLAQGHNQIGQAVPNWDIITLEGAGALRSDVQDMLKFIGANIGTADSPLEKAIRNSHQARANYAGNADIGLNWVIIKAGNDRIIMHTGMTGGYYSFVGFDPDRAVGVVVLTNSSYPNEDIGLHLVNPALPIKEPVTARSEIEVSTDILETYIGNYQLTPDLVLTISLENGTLWGQATGQNKIEIYPESDTEFFYKMLDAQITFKKDHLGNVNGLVLHQGGVDIQAPKL